MAESAVFLDRDGVLNRALFRDGEPVCAAAAGDSRAPERGLQPASR